MTLWKLDMNCLHCESDKVVKNGHPRENKAIFVKFVIASFENDSKLQCRGQRPLCQDVSFRIKLLLEVVFS